MAMIAELESDPDCSIQAVVLRRHYHTFTMRSVENFGILGKLLRAA